MIKKKKAILFKMRILIPSIWLLACFPFAGIKSFGQDKLYLNEFPLSDVTLTDGVFKHALDLNTKVLLEYDVNRLLAGFRKEAGLPEKAKSFPNWDGLDGHIAGHYLSAMAMSYAATGNLECKKRMDYMLGELQTCQQANGGKYPSWGTGYAGAVPHGDSCWSKIKSGEVSVIWKYWVPWYNVHKMYAGLRDAWLYTGNEKAKDIFLKFCDWGISITAGLSDAAMEEMLGSEQGGMNEVFADAYQMTKDTRYLTAAKRFSHKWLLDAMADSRDNLDNKHANTQVPKAVGFERIAELSGDEKYKMAGRFFWQTVTQNRSLAFGGNSRREFFPGTEACRDFINEVEGPESCNSYNMLKLTEDLFRVAPKAEYADYYERTLYNHILATQHPVHGGYVYFTPARPRHYRVYSAPNEAMWCCVGSGMENHGKYGQFIYTHRNDSLYVNLFIASTLNWKEKQIQVKQETLFPDEEKTTLRITSGSSRFTMMIRYPGWMSKGSIKITVNNKPVSINTLPSSYIAINRNWRKGDVVMISLPMTNRIEHMPNVPEYIAFMRGPVLLGAKTGTEDLKGLLAGDSRWGHIASGKILPVNQAPVIVEDNQEIIPSKLVKVKGQATTFSTGNIRLVNSGKLKLEPFYKIHDSRYMIYWMSLSGRGYISYLDSLKANEQLKIALQKKTVDFVAPGEQQPEADHFIKQENSGTGVYLDEFWRNATRGGYFSYNLSTNNETNLTLVVRYWGNESGNRKFDIYIDDVKLVSEDLSGKWKQPQFRETEYSIPDALVSGKPTIRVKFQSIPGNTAGSVYYLRLTRNTIKKQE